MLLFRRVCVATALTIASGIQAEAATTMVGATADLQAALDAARPGDVLMLAAGVTFTGNFTLPAKSGTTHITVRSAAPDSQLPGPGVRMTPAYAARLPKIRSVNSAPALRTAPGAHHWRLQWLEFPATMLGYGEILRIGEGGSLQSALSQVPYEIEVDGVYLHGSPLHGQKRGIALNGAYVTIKNSHISEIKAVGFDAQAIAGWNGPGPFRIENNYLEASGENFLLGGSDPAIAGLVTEDVRFRYNHVSRPLDWRNPIVPTPANVSAVGLEGVGLLPAGAYQYGVIARREVGAGSWGRSTLSAQVSAHVGDRGAVSISWEPVANATEYRVYGRGQFWTVSGRAFTDTGAPGTAGALPIGDGTRWQVKNLFELKNARRVTIEYNLFENNWAHAQKGYAILFTPRNQDGGCNWCVVEDVTFQHNVVRNVAGGVSVLGFDSPNPSAQTNAVKIRHNLFYGITKTLGGPGWFLLVGDEARDLIVEHNTIDFDGTTAVYAYGGTALAPRPMLGFQFLNNALRHSTYGINGASLSYGTATLSGYFPGALVEGNWFAGGNAVRYPAGNLFNGTFTDAFVNAGGGDYRLALNSLLAGRATDGRDIGADISALWNGAPTKVITSPTPTPTKPGGLRVVR